MPKFVVKLGENFEVSDLEVLKDYEVSRDRRNIAYIILGSSFVALTTATVIGFILNDLLIVGHVWAAAGPLVGGVVGYYMESDKSQKGIYKCLKKRRGCK